MSQKNLSAEWQFFDGGTGYARYANPAAAKRLTDTPAAGVTLPKNATHAFIFVHDAAVRIKVDADAVATGSEGGIWPAGYIQPVENNRGFLKRLSFINDTASPAEVVVIYARIPNGTEAS